MERRTFLKGLFGALICPWDKVAAEVMTLPPAPLLVLPKGHEQFLLRPIREPLYDTEMFDKSGAGTERNFFKRPANFYRFDLQKPALRIRPGETFSVKIDLASFADRQQRRQWQRRQWQRRWHRKHRRAR